MEALPPHPWDELATKADLALLKTDVAGLKTDFDRLEERVDLKLEAMGHQLVGAFRGELNTAITAQTRTMWLSSLTSVIAIGSLVLAAARL